jgi:glycosyltransferase involved in cell wall biosynthesis
MGTMLTESRTGTPSDTSAVPLSTVVDHQRSPVSVLFIIDELCEPGGAERCLLQMIRLLPPAQFRCSLLTFRLDRSALFACLPCPTYVYPLIRTYDLNAVKVALKLRALIRQQDIRIVTTFFETSDLWAGVLAKAFGVPVLVSSRRDMGILRSTKHRLAYKGVSRLYDAIITVSEKVRQQCLRRDRVAPHKVVTLYSGVDLKRIDTSEATQVTRASLGISDAAPVIATVAHIRKVKGIDVLVRAASEVHHKYPDAVFLVVGDVPEKEKDHFGEVQDLCRQLQLDSVVRFVGSSESIPSILKLANVFCLPSRSEGFSNALIEAMACNLPCVATRVGGNDEAILEGLNGYLVESEDAVAMADRICALLAMPEAAVRMGQAGRKIVEANFSDDAMRRKLVELYSALLEAKHA